MSTVQGAPSYQRPYAGTDAYLNKLYSAPNLVRIQDRGLINFGGTLDQSDTSTLKFGIGGMDATGLLSSNGIKRKCSTIYSILGCSVLSNTAISRAQLHSYGSPQARSASTQPIRGTPSASARALPGPATDTGPRARTGHAFHHPPPSKHDSPSSLTSHPSLRDPAHKVYFITTIGWLTALLAIPMTLTLGAASTLVFLEFNFMFRSAFPLWLTSGFLHGANSALTIILDRTIHFQSTGAVSEAPAEIQRRGTAAEERATGKFYRRHAMFCVHLSACYGEHLCCCVLPEWQQFCAWFRRRVAELPDLSGYGDCERERAV